LSNEVSDYQLAGIAKFYFDQGEILTGICSNSKHPAVPTQEVETLKVPVISLLEFHFSMKSFGGQSTWAVILPMNYVVGINSLEINQYADTYITGTSGPTGFQTFKRWRIVALNTNEEGY
jgi:hypothetical protein